MKLERQLLREMILREIRREIKSLSKSVLRDVAQAIVSKYGIDVLNSMLDAEVESLIYDQMCEMGLLGDDWPDILDAVYDELLTMGVKPSGVGGIEGGE